MRRILTGFSVLVLGLGFASALADDWIRIGSPQGPASAWFANLDTRVTDETGITKYWAVVRYKGDMVLRKDKPVGTLMLLLGDRCDKNATTPLGPYKAVYYDHQKKLIEKVEKPARLSWFSLLTPELSKKHHQLICSPEVVRKQSDPLPTGAPEAAAATSPESGQVKRRKLILEELTKSAKPPAVSGVPDDKTKTDKSADKTDKAGDKPDTGDKK